jgi:hypothetical protein
VGMEPGLGWVGRREVRGSVMQHPAAYHLIIHLLLYFYILIALLLSVVLFYYGYRFHVLHTVDTFIPFCDLLLIHVETGGSYGDTVCRVQFACSQ